MQNMCQPLPFSAGVVPMKARVGGQACLYFETAGLIMLSVPGGTAGVLIRVPARYSEGAPESKGVDDGKCAFLAN